MVFQSVTVLTVRVDRKDTVLELGSQHCFLDPTTADTRPELALALSVRRTTVDEDEPTAAWGREVGLRSESELASWGQSLVFECDNRTLGSMGFRCLARGFVSIVVVWSRDLRRKSLLSHA